MADFINTTILMQLEAESVNINQAQTGFVTTSISTSIVITNFGAPTSLKTFKRIP